jgi:hypothetical protein
MRRTGEHQEETFWATSLRAPDERLCDGQGSRTI